MFCPRIVESRNLMFCISVLILSLCRNSLEVKRPPWTTREVGWRTRKSER